MAAVVGRLTKERVVEVRAELDSAIGASGPLVLDLRGVTEIDSSGVALLVVLERRLASEGRSLTISHVPPAVERTLQMFPRVIDEALPDKKRVGVFEQLGKGGESALDVGLQFLVLAADTAWFTVEGFLRRRGIRWNAVVYEMSAMGSKAVGVVGLIAFLVGATMALQSAVQLRQFGANIFVVDLIGISMTRELGPLMAAIVVAGRSGSSVAAEIGTMVITEEVDALRTMGLHPTRFLVVPKIIAITITQPLITVLADVAGIFGGFLVAMFYLDIGPDTFIQRLQESLYLKDLLTGLVKSVTFAQLIVTVGAICGFRTKGGADAVGRSTTAAVVAGIFTVIVADAAASLLFYFGE